ncbi:MAG: tRNA epoxyqueuosine(34) reductase QueG [Bacteroidota bacterium]|jgi:epoxyqueuosine reductase
MPTHSDLKAAENAQLIKQLALEIGFSFCGISKANFLSEEAPRLEKWLKQSMQGEMSYMENHFDMRLDPRLLVPGAKSVVSFLFNYFPNPEIAIGSGALKVSKYAWGEDYHYVVKDKLKLLMQQLTERIGAIEGRAFVDSAPVLDKVWAKKSGLGWLGKNANLINKKQGSFFFIAELIIDLELEPDGPVTDHCGTCRACIDACPTEAIVEPYVVDGSKCISYFTIELKKDLPPEWISKMDGWLFGCDVCQDVCPWNRFSVVNAEPRFTPREHLLNMSSGEWQDLSEEVFEQLARRSPLKRKGLDGLRRNASLIGANSIGGK